MMFILHKNNIALIVIFLIYAGLSGRCDADLDEKGFENYKIGALHSQHGWSKRFKGNVVISREEKTGNKFVLFNKFSSSIIKNFPATESNQVIIEFDFIPGAETIGGRLYFLKDGNQTVFALQFINGTLHARESYNGKTHDTDTGVEFRPDEWNHFRLKLDFRKKECQIYMNKKDIGTYNITDKKVSYINMLNFFGGKAGGISCLDNLVIKSVPAKHKMKINLKKEIEK